VPSDREIPAERGVAKFLAIYNCVLLSLAAATMGLIVAIMGVQVFYRYALNDSLIWAEEICRYLLMVMTFLLLGIAFERGEMVSVQFMMHALPRRVASALMVPIYCLMIAFLLVISYFGFRYASFNGRFSMPAIDFILASLSGREVSGALSMYWIYMLIPAGCLILAIHVALAMLRTLRAVFGDRKAA
jgi:TRAP-type C4-dicarboxylate transport system permease small subunit